MCLLVMAFGLDPDAPLVVAANRDERTDRPATPMTVLRRSDPRILGGRDDLAGGTWLAVNSSGLVAGLTNSPLPDGRDPTRRTRGELPLALAGHRSAADAVQDFVDRFSPSEYNPAWFLVGDRESLYSIDLTDGPRPRAVSLGPGLHILENAPLGAPSAKVDHVRFLLQRSGVDPPETGGPPAGPILMETLRSLLADHRTAGSGTAGSATAGSATAGSATAGSATAGSVTSASGTAASEGRRPETMAACVHTDDYGTRSSTLIRVPAREGDLPQVLYADGHPCTAPFRDAGPLWTEGAG